MKRKIQGLYERRDGYVRKYGPSAVGSVERRGASIVLDWMRQAFSMGWHARQNYERAKRGGEQR